MGIEFVKFPQGLPFDTTKPKTAFAKIEKEIQSGRARAELLPAGEYDITPIPSDGRRTAFEYNLIVYPNGDATLRTIPRTSNSEIGEYAKIGSDTLFSVRRGGHPYRVPQDYPRIPITVLNRDNRGYSIYAYIRHVPGRSPRRK